MDRNCNNYCSGNAESKSGRSRYMRSEVNKILSEKEMFYLCFFLLFLAKCNMFGVVYLIFVVILMTDFLLDLF